jgi:hypothetical protein
MDDIAKYSLVPKVESGLPMTSILALSAVCSQETDSNEAGFASWNDA